jgi:hypothetical protein
MIVRDIGIDQATDPLAAGGTWTSTSALDTLLKNLASSNWDTLADKLHKARMNDGNQPGWIYQGLLGSGVPIGPIAGLGGGGQFLSPVGNGPTMAHELGHAIGRDHAPRNEFSFFPIAGVDPNYPFYEPYDPQPSPGMTRNTASIGEYGLDIRDGTVKLPSTMHDFMAYTSSRWISLMGHVHAANSPWLGGPGGVYQGGASPSPSPSEHLVSVTGLLHEDGQHSVTSVARLAATPALPGWHESNTIAELTGADGTVLSRAIVLTADLHDAYANPGFTEASDQRPRTRIFQAFLAPVDRPHSLRLRTGEDIHWERRAPARKPKIKITTCKLDSSGHVRLAWVTEVDDESEPQVWIQSELRGRRGWRGVAIDVTADSVSLNAAELPAGSIRFRLLLLDGFATATATTPFVELPARPPRLTIIHPYDGAHIEANAPGLAWAAGYDDQGDPLPPEHFKWFIDGDEIGSGVQVPIPRLVKNRRYTLEVQANDAQASCSIKTRRSSPRISDDSVPDSAE